MGRLGPAGASGTWAALASNAGQVAHHEVEVVFRRVHGVDDDLRLAQRLVQLAPSLDPLPRELVPTWNISVSTFDSAAMQIDVGADALNYGERRSLPVRQRAPFVPRLLARHEIEDAAPGSTKLLLGDTGQQLPADPTLQLDRLLDSGPDLVMTPERGHQPVEARHTGSDLDGEEICHRRLPGSGPTGDDDEP